MKLLTRGQARRFLLWLTLAALLALQCGAMVHRVVHVHADTDQYGRVSARESGHFAGWPNHAQGSGTCVALDAVLLTPGLGGVAPNADANGFADEAPRGIKERAPDVAPGARPRVRDPPMRLNA